MVRESQSGGGMQELVRVAGSGPGKSLACWNTLDHDVITIHPSCKLHYQVCNNREVLALRKSYSLEFPRQSNFSVPARNYEQCNRLSVANFPGDVKNGGVGRRCIKHETNQLGLL